MIHAGFERFSVKNSNFHRDEPFLISSGFGSLIRGSRQYFCSSLSQESSELCQPSRNELPPLPTRYTIRPFLDPSLWRMWESDFRSTTKRVGIIGEESGVFMQIVTRWRPIFIFNSMDSIYDLLRLLSQDLPLWNIVIDSGRNKNKNVCTSYATLRHLEKRLEAWHHIILVTGINTSFSNSFRNMPSIIAV